MVFPGRFSTGCMQCRKRKVKCDEGKPSCRRCQVYVKPCPGYTDQFNFRYNSRGSSDDGAVIANGSPSTEVSSSPNRRPSHTSDSSDTTSEWSTDQTIIAPRIDLSHNDISLYYFVNRFVAPSGMDGFPGYLNFLPLLFDHRRTGLLEMATLSVAQMAAYNQFRDERFRIDSYRNYGRTVKGLRETIDCDEEVTDDRVLATVLLLCVFKDICDEGFVDPAEHASGIYYLIAKRGVEQLATCAGFELLMFALMRLQVYSFVHDDDKYNDPGGVTTFLSMFDPLIRAMAIMAHILKLRRTISKNIAEAHNKPDLAGGSSTDPTNEQRDEAIFKSCAEVFQELDDWEAEAPKHWARNFHGRTAPAKLGQVASAGNHYDSETACTMMLIRTSRLVLLSSMDEYFIRFHHNSFDALLVVLAEDIRLTIDDALACVPYAMGDVNGSGQPASLSHDGAAALVILPSLRLVTYCSLGNPEQVQAAQRFLDRIHNLIGLRIMVPRETSLAVCKIGAKAQICCT